MSKAKDARLQVVWDHGQVIGGPTDPTPWRYVPRAYNAAGPGWGVYDRAEGRFIEFPELYGLSPETLANALLVDKLS